MLRLLRAVYERLFYRYVALITILLCLLAVSWTSGQTALDNAKVAVSVLLGMVLALFFRPLVNQLHEEKEGIYWLPRSSHYSVYTRIIATILYAALVVPISFGMFYFGLAALSFGVLSLFIVLMIEKTKSRPLYVRSKVDTMM
jgi:hypothetical protein